jgi:hypothetical protein
VEKNSQNFQEQVKTAILKICHSHKTALRIHDVLMLSLKEFSLANPYKSAFHESIQSLVKENYLHIQELQDFKFSSDKKTIEIDKLETIIWISNKGIRYLEIDNDFKEMIKIEKPPANLTVPKNCSLN